MAGRYPLVATALLGVTLAAIGWEANPAVAQAPSLAPQYAPPQYSAAPAGGYSPSSFVPQPYSATGGYPPASSGSMNALGGHQVRSPRTTFEELPDDTGWLYRDTTLERTLKDGFRHGYIRMEYLSWNITRPSNATLAAPNQAGLSPAPLAGEPAQVPTFIDLDDPYSGNAAGQGTQPNLSPVGLNGTQGVRGTYGLPLSSGALELSAFFLQAAETTFQNALNSPNSTTLPTNLIYQPVFVNGSPNDPTTALLLYNVTGANGYNYTYDWRTVVWGAEANYILDAPNPNDSFQIRPIAGFRYLNIRETLNQQGSYAFTDQGNVTGVTEDLVRKINSEANNNYYGGQVGLRAEVATKYATFGFEPKAMVGLNQYVTNLYTSQLFAPTSTAQPDRDQRISKTTFGPVIDLGAYSKIHLSENFSLFVNYQFLYAGFVTRPHTNIVYNATNVTPTGTGDGGNGLVSNLQDNFQLVPKFTNVVIQGITVGAELRF